jgi:hypothetical protein
VAGRVAYGNRAVRSSALARRELPRRRMRPPEVDEELRSESVQPSAPSEEADMAGMTFDRRDDRAGLLSNSVKGR